ncbi:hypothetical protein [Maribacter sp. 2308TA10-17]|uniref:hypothetical protein n=1 Tax=Maribacter sp. 2308TA10-17 TaxID=3386276 RepID=UPI0039BC9234
MKNLCKLIVVFTTCAFSQSPESYFNDVNLPSPAAYEMTRYDAQLPNLYTGTASVNIPLYTINFDGFNLPLSLSYHASGVKVNQEATEAGLGWSLNATGVISRTIKGTDDFGDGNNRKGYLNETLDFYNKVLNWGDLLPSERLIHQQNMVRQFYDFEPDIFSYSFFGYSGSFTLTRRIDDSGNNDKVHVKKLSIDPVKINFFENTTNIQNSYFTVTTPDGFVGYFNVKEFTTSFSGSFAQIPFPDIVDQICTFRAAEGINRFEVQKAHLRDITAWYLDRIESPNGKTIDFTYNINTDTELSNYISIGMPSFSELESPGSNPHDKGFSRQVTEHIYLEQIVLNNELQIDFEMENRNDIGRFDLFSLAGFFPQFSNGNQQTLAYLRQNLPFLKRYKRITVQGLETNSILDKQITFRQSYFNQHYQIYGSEIDKYLYLRSRLDGITIEDQKYEFNYSNGQGGLPWKITFGQDHTGAYNGKFENQKLNPVTMPFPLFDFSTSSPLDYPDRFHYYITQERKPNLNFALGGVLEQVRYPTGGYSTYTYDLQEFQVEGNQNGSGWTNATTDSKRYVPAAINEQGDPGAMQVGGLRIKEILTYDKNDVIEYKKSYDYTSQFATTSSGELMVPLVHLGNIYNNPENPDPSTVSYTVEKSKNLPGKSLAQGNLIGYNKVTEKVWSKTGDSYSSVHSFESQPTKIEDSYVSMTNYDNINGQLKLKEEKDNFDFVVQNSSVDQFENTVLENIKAVGYNLYRVYYSGELLGLVGNYALHPYELPISFVRPSQVTNTTFFSSASPLSATSSFSYDGFGQQKTITTTGSNGELIETEIFRIKDYCDTCGPTVNGKSMNQWMADDNNMVSSPIEQINKIDGVIVSAIAYEYGLEHNNVVLKQIYRHNGDKAAYTPSADGFTFIGGYEPVISFDKYNENGKLLQQTIANGKITSYIWDPFSNYPVVKGENIDYDDLLIAYNSSLGASFEEDLRNHALTQSALITTYDADTWVGIKKMIDPSLIAQQFEYDENERLKSIRDIDQNLLTDYDYQIGGYTKVGGLVSESLNLGQTKPLGSNTREVEIINNSNYGITITNIVTSSYFSTSFYWPPGYQVYLAPNDRFKVPITFNAPLQENTYSGTLTVSSDDINGDLNISLSGTSIDFFSQLNIPNDCFVIGSYQDANDQTQLLSTDTKMVRIENTGNGPLYFTNITSNDDNLIVSYPTKYKYDEEGNRYVDYYVIPANWHIDVAVQMFSFAYTEIGDWDNTGDITFNYINDDGSQGAASIDFHRYPNICQNEPNDPPSFFTNDSDTTADCDFGMSGSIVVNSGSILIFNKTNRTAGNQGSGVKIYVTSGPGDGIAAGGSIVLTPTSYPTTYDFWSDPATCVDFYGTAEIVVTDQ